MQFIEIDLSHSAVALSECTIPT